MNLSADTLWKDRCLLLSARHAPPLSLASKPIWPPVLLMAFLQRHC